MSMQPSSSQTLPIQNGSGTPGSKLSGATPSSNTPSGNPPAFKTSFANKDMSVNKMYAKFQERFGSASVPAQQTPPLASAAHSSQRRREEHNSGVGSGLGNNNESGKDSRSPEMLEDMMVESTGMQRSSAVKRPAPSPRTAVALQSMMANATRELESSSRPSSSRQQTMQERIANISHSLNQVVERQNATQNPPQTSTQPTFQGSFQRAPKVPLPQNQPDQPRLNTRHGSHQSSTQNSDLPLDSGSNRRALQPETRVGNFESRAAAIEGGLTSTSSQSRLKMKLADYLSPATSDRGRDVSPKPTVRSNSGANRAQQKRDNARNLLSTLESTWIPTLTRVKADAFEKIKAHQPYIYVQPHIKNQIVSTFESVQSFGPANQMLSQHRNDQQSVPLLIQGSGGGAATTLSEQTAKFEAMEDPKPLQVIQGVIAPPINRLRMSAPISMAAESNDSPRKRQLSESTYEPKHTKKTTLLKKKQFLAPASTTDNWRSTTPKSGSGQDNAPKKFDFTALESLQKQKFEEIANLGHQIKPEEVEKDRPRTPNGQIDEDSAPEASSIIHNFPGKKPQTKSMLSPNSSSHLRHDDYQYPNAEEGSVVDLDVDIVNDYLIKGPQPQTRSVYKSQSIEPQSKQRRQCNTIDEAPAAASNNYHYFNQELGEGPVSAQPTDFTAKSSDSQVVSMSQPDLKTFLNEQHQPQGAMGSRQEYLMNQINSSDNKTANILDRSPQPKQDLARIAALAHHQDSSSLKKDSGVESSLGPMKLEFLSTGGEDAQETSQSAQAAAAKIQQIQPLQSIFSGDALEKAKKVSQDIAERIAKIKAVKEDILRPRESKSKSSVRSGRQMSDHDYEVMTKELGMNIQLRKITGSEASSEIDQQSDFGGDQRPPIGAHPRLRESNPATLEYFAPDSAPPKKSRKAQHAIKRSLDFKQERQDLSVGGGGPLHERKSDLVSPLLQSSTGLMNTQPLTSPLSVEELKFEELAPSVEEQGNNELEKLKMQNALLLLSKSVDKHSSIAQRVFLGRWRAKVWDQKSIMDRLASHLVKAMSFERQTALKSALQEWKTFKDILIQEEIQEDLNAVRLMQKNLLGNIKRSFQERLQQRMLCRYFNMYMEVYQVRQKKKQACTRLMRVLKRQVRKRQRNSWKAISRQPFVSDLADEEVFSLNSGSVKNLLSGVHKRESSPLGVQQRCVSAQHSVSPRHTVVNSSATGGYGTGRAGDNRVVGALDVASPLHQSSRRTTTTMSAAAAPQGLDPTTAASIEAQARIAKIKAGVKLFTLYERRQLIHGREELSMQAAFHSWKTRAAIARKASQLDLPLIDDFLTTVDEQRPQMSLSVKNTLTGAQIESFGDPYSSNTRNEANPIKQASFRNKPNMPIEQIYGGAEHSAPSEQAKTEEGKVMTPEHEVHPEMLGMLSDENASSTHQAPRQPSPRQQEDHGPEEPIPGRDGVTKEEAIVTTSDISSVELDSDDSCFAATVEVIKLAPVKKAGGHQTSAARTREEKMPSTTNVSQIDPYDTKQLSANRVDVYSDDRQVEARMLVNMVGSSPDNPRSDLHAAGGGVPLQQFNEAASSVNDQPFSAPLEQPKRVRKTRQPVRPNFTRMSVPTIDQIPLVTKKAPSARKNLQTSPSVRDQQVRSQSSSTRHKQQQYLVHQRASAAAFDPVGPVQQVPNGPKAQRRTTAKATGSKTRLMRPTTTQLKAPTSTTGSIFQGKSMSLQTSSRQFSSSREVLDTPQFRRSLVSNAQVQNAVGRKRSQESIQEPKQVYYERIEKPKILIKQAPSQRIKKTTLVRQSSAEQREKDKQILISKLAKVAEAQIAADLHLQGIKKKEKVKTLTKQQERKTKKLLEKKDLRGVVVGPSQAINLVPQKSDPARKGPKSVTLAQNKSLTRNQSTKSSFISQVRPSQQQVPQNQFVSKATPSWAQLQLNTHHRSQIVTPNRRAESRPSRSRACISTKSHRSPKPKAEAIKAAKNLAKINIGACLHNTMKVKMPLTGYVQPQQPQIKSARPSDLTSKHTLYTQVGPFEHKKTGAGKRTRSNNMRRTASKSSLQTTSDRHLKSTYEPPEYKSRAFRAQRERSTKGRNAMLQLNGAKMGDFASVSHNVEEQLFLHQQRSQEHELQQQQIISQMSLQAAQEMMMATDPQIHIEGSNLQMLDNTPLTGSHVVQSPVTYHEESHHGTPDPQQHLAYAVQDVDGQDHHNNFYESEAPLQTNIVVEQHQPTQIQAIDGTYEEGEAASEAEASGQEPVPSDGGLANEEVECRQGVQQSHYDDMGPHDPIVVNSYKEADSDGRGLGSAERPGVVGTLGSSDEQNAPDWLTGSIEKNDKRLSQGLSGRGTHRDLVDVYGGSVQNRKETLTGSARGLEEGEEDTEQRFVRNLNSVQEKPTLLERAQALSSQLKQSCDDPMSSGANFTLGKQSSQASHTATGGAGTQGVQDRRLTFGRQPEGVEKHFAAASSAEEPYADENPMRHLLINAEQKLQAVETGLARLSRALKPRIERYKVELFIHLCENLDSSDEEGQGEEEGDYQANYQYAEAAAENEQIQIHEVEPNEAQASAAALDNSEDDEDEDVYGSGKYSRPRQMGNANQYFPHQQQQY